LKPLVIQTEQLDAEAGAWLAERAELVVCPSEDRDRFFPLLARAEGMVIRTYTRIDRELLDRAPRLRVVARAGVGLDNVDLAACRARGVTVVSTPDANTRAVVEFVFTLLFDALRPRQYVETPLDVRAWKGAREQLIAPRQLSALTLGVVGLGRIGSRVARAGAAFDMRVLYNDLLEIPADQRRGALPVGFEQLLEESDIITLHVDSRPTNRHLVSSPQLARCKPDVILVNTSRGFVLDAAAAGAFLRAHPRALALLDVHDPEPFDASYPLLGLANARLTPHIAAATAVAHRNMSWVVRDLWLVLNGEPPMHPA
jgi:D-3-phosphoglycerate dehydrogenase